MPTKGLVFFFVVALQCCTALAANPPEVVAGTGNSAICPVESGVLATKTSVNPGSFTFGPSGDLYIYDSGCSPATLRKIDAASGIISTLSMSNPPVGQFSALAFDASGTLYLAIGSSGTTTPGLGLFRVD